MKPREIFISLAASLATTTIIVSQFYQPILWTLIITLPLILVGVMDILNKKIQSKIIFLSSVTCDIYWKLSDQ